MFGADTASHELIRRVSELLTSPKADLIKDRFEKDRFKDSIDAIYNDFASFLLIHLTDLQKYIYECYEDIAQSSSEDKLKARAAKAIRSQNHGRLVILFRYLYVYKKLTGEYYLTKLEESRFGPLDKTFLDKDNSPPKEKSLDPEDIKNYNEFKKILIQNSEFKKPDTSPTSATANASPVLTITSPSTPRSSSAADVKSPLPASSAANAETVLTVTSPSTPKSSSAADVKSPKPSFSVVPIISRTTINTLQGILNLHKEAENMFPGDDKVKAYLKGSGRWKDFLKFKNKLRSDDNKKGFLVPKAKRNDQVWENFIARNLKAFVATPNQVSFESFKEAIQLGVATATLRENEKTEGERGITAQGDNEIAEKRRKFTSQFLSDLTTKLPRINSAEELYEMMYPYFGFSNVSIKDKGGKDTGETINFSEIAGSVYNPNRANMGSTLSRLYDLNAQIAKKLSKDIISFNETSLKTCLGIFEILRKLEQAYESSNHELSCDKIKDMEKELDNLLTHVTAADINLWRYDLTACYKVSKGGDSKEMFSNLCPQPILHMARFSPSFLSKLLSHKKKDDKVEIDVNVADKSGNMLINLLYIKNAINSDSKAVKNSDVAKQHAFNELAKETLRVLLKKWETLKFDGNLKDKQLTKSGEAKSLQPHSVFYQYLETESYELADILLTETIRRKKLPFASDQDISKVAAKKWEIKSQLDQLKTSPQSELKNSTNDNNESEKLKQELNELKSFALQNDYVPNTAKFMETSEKYLLVVTMYGQLKGEYAKESDDLIALYRIKRAQYRIHEIKRLQDQLEILKRTNADGKLAIVDKTDQSNEHTLTQNLKQAKVQLKNQLKEIPVDFLLRPGNHEIHKSFWSFLAKDNKDVIKEMEHSNEQWLKLRPDIDTRKLFKRIDDYLHTQHQQFLDLTNFYRSVATAKEKSLNVSRADLKECEITFKNLFEKRDKLIADQKTNPDSHREHEISTLGETIKVSLTTKEAIETDLKKHKAEYNKLLEVRLFYIAYVKIYSRIQRKIIQSLLLLLPPAYRTVDAKQLDTIRKTHQHLLKEKDALARSLIHLAHQMTRQGMPSLGSGLLMNADISNELKLLAGNHAAIEQKQNEAEKQFAIFQRPAEKTRLHTMLAGLWFGYAPRPERSEVKSPKNAHTPVSAAAADIKENEAKRTEGAAPLQNKTALHKLYIWGKCIRLLSTRLEEEAKKWGYAPRVAAKPK